MSNGHDPVPPPNAAALARDNWPDHACFAAFYGILERFEPKRFIEVRQRVAGGAHGRVLEIGCGTGANFAHYDWTGVEQLVASEPDHNMFQRAKTRVEHLPAAVQAKVRLHWAPAEALGIDDDDPTFDTIVSTLVLCSVFDPVLAIAEAKRHLRPNGELRLFEHVAGHGITGLLQRTIQPAYGRISGGCNLHRDTEATLRNAGFTLTIEERLKLSPLMPAFVATAKLSR